MTRSQICLGFLLFASLSALAQPNGYSPVQPERLKEYTFVMAQAVEQAALDCTGTTAEGENFEAPLFQIIAILQAATEVYVKTDRTQPILYFVTYHGPRRIESLVTTSVDLKSPEKVEIVQDDTLTTVINDGDLTDPNLREQKRIIRTATGLCQKAAVPFR